MIRFRDVHYRHPGGPPLLVGVDFELAAGEALVVTGPSGIGKSTLARLATGLVRPDRGSVAVAGVPPLPRPGRCSPAQLVFQDSVDAFNPRLTLARSLAETGADRARMCAALAVVDLDPLLLDERPAALSGGERQRMGVCRALLADARVLVVDEPLAQLDPVSALAVVDALAAARVARNCALLVLSHMPHWLAPLEARFAALADGALESIDDREERAR